MDDSQRTILAADIRASTDPDVVAALAIRNDTELTRLYNLTSSFIVWLESVTPEIYREGFDWDEVEVLSEGKKTVWNWITGNMLQPYNATKQNIREGLGVAWGGTNTATNLIALSEEACNITEELYATGTGTTQSPGIRVFVGALSVSDTSKALNMNP